VLGPRDPYPAFEQAPRLQPVLQLRGRRELIAGIVRHALLHIAPQIDRIHEVVEQRDVTRNLELLR
jgi:hypothetical protein